MQFLMDIANFFFDKILNVNSLLNEIKDDKKKKKKTKSKDKNRSEGFSKSHKNNSSNSVTIKTVSSNRKYIPRKATVIKNENDHSNNHSNHMNNNHLFENSDKSKNNKMNDRRLSKFSVGSENEKINYSILNNNNYYEPDSFSESVNSIPIQLSKSKYDNSKGNNNISNTVKRNSKFKPSFYKLNLNQNETIEELNEENKDSPKNMLSDKEVNNINKDEDKRRFASILNEDKLNKIQKQTLKKSKFLLAKNLIHLQNENQNSNKNSNNNSQHSSDEENEYIKRLNEKSNEIFSTRRENSLSRNTLKSIFNKNKNNEDEELKPKVKTLFNNQMNSNRLENRTISISSVVNNRKPSENKQ